MSQPADHVEVLQVSPFDILLDPNSYRLVDDPLWEPVPDDQIPSPQVQSRALTAVVGESRFRLRDLRGSMEAHGWLEIEPLWVRRLAGGQLVAIDGNRRLVAWRMVHGAHGPQQTLFSQAAMASQILAHVVSNPEGKTASVLLGLRHLLPPSTWPPLGFAVWRDRHQGAHGEVPDAGAVRPYRRWNPHTEDLALRLARQFASQWGAEARPNIYSLLLEALSQRPIAAWLAPGGEEPDEARVARLLDWFAPREAEEPADQGDGETMGPDVSALFRVPGIRQFAALLDDPATVEKLDAGLHPSELIAETYASRQVVDPGDYLHPWVDAQIARNRPLDPGRAQAALVRLREAIRRAQEEPVESGTQHPWPLLEPDLAVRFESLVLNRYRGLAGVTLDGLQRVNLLVGVNNAGKTSVLESVYILSRLSDPRGILDTLRVRTRQDPERDPGLLSTLMERLEVDIQAVDSGDRPISLKLARLPVSEGADLSTHIPGMTVEATLAGTRHATATELSSQRPRRTVQAQGKSAWLARAVLHSPYARMDRAAIMRFYEETVEAGALQVIVDALREAIDDGIEDLRLVSDSGRFVVEHRDRAPMDISAYGEGLQRVFEIGLLFAAHRGGLALIDEIETAIHPGAMLRFTKLVQELAVKFDVQVFITTHSKETVDAFILNNYRTDDIVAFGLYRRADGIEVVRYPGQDLAEAIEAINIDIRRG